MLRDLSDRFPHFRQRVEALGGKQIIDALNPRSPYSAEAAQRHLTQTEICQPAMAALSVALTELLASFGVIPDVVLGHSLGEFVAASAAGMLTGEDAVKLVARRGQLMSELKLTDTGAMLAVMAPRAEVEKLISGLAGVVMANHNHPTQVVLSGEDRRHRHRARAARSRGSQNRSARSVSRVPLSP